ASAPSASPRDVVGDVPAAAAAPSRLHSNVAVLSFDVNAKDAFWRRVVEVGALAIHVVMPDGATVVQVFLAPTGSGVPTSFTALAANVCVPRASPVYAAGDVHPVQPAPSRL